MQEVRILLSNIDYIILFVCIGFLLFAIAVVIAIFLSKKKKKKQEEISKKALNKGKKGEAIVENYLSKYALENDGFYLGGFILFYEGKSEEIDHLLLLKTGIYIFETKNWRGIVHGHLKDPYWTVTYEDSDEVSKRRNPIIQNSSHIGFFLKQFALKKDNKNMHGRVIFVQDNLLDIDCKAAIKFSDLESYLSLKTEEVFTKDFLENIYKQCLDFKLNPRLTKEEHLDFILKKKNKEK